MYVNLSEMLVERGLQDISIQDFLALPDTEDHASFLYLEHLLDAAYDTDMMRNEVADGAVACVCSELERLWDESLELLVDETIVIDIFSFWRVLRIMPISYIFYGTSSDTEPSPIDWDSLLEVLRYGFICNRDLPLEQSDFESTLSNMPEEIIYEFLAEMHDEDRLQCLIRLTLSDEGVLFDIDETYVRSILHEGGSYVRNAMLQFFDGLGIEFTLDFDAAYDPAWRTGCDCDCDYDCENCAHDCGCEDCSCICSYNDCSCDCDCDCDDCDSNYRDERVGAHDYGYDPD